MAEKGGERNDLRGALAAGVAPGLLVLQTPAATAVWYGFRPLFNSI